MLKKIYQITKKQFLEGDFPGTYSDLLCDCDSYSITTIHHTSWVRGYISRRNEFGNPNLGEEIKLYNGKFGVGFTQDRPSWKSTRYHLRDYYIIPDSYFKQEEA